MAAENSGASSSAPWWPSWPNGSGGRCAAYHAHRTEKRQRHVQGVREDWLLVPLFEAHADSMPLSPNPLDFRISKAQWEYEFREWQRALRSWAWQVREEHRAAVS